MKIFFFTGCLALMITSCAGYSFQKKRYSRGFYISKTNRNNIKSEEMPSNYKKEIKNYSSTNFQDSLVEVPGIFNTITSIDVPESLNGSKIEKEETKSKLEVNNNSTPLNFNGFSSQKNNFHFSTNYKGHILVKKRNDFLNFWDNVVTGYYIIVTIIVVVIVIYYLFTFFPFTVALLYAAIILGVILLLAGIGMLANNQF